MSDETRSVENHPNERGGDGHGRFGRALQIIWMHKLYRDFWLFAISVVVLLAISTNSQQTEDIQKTQAAVQTSRLEALMASCLKSNENTTAINDAFLVIQNLIMAGAALPGDKPVPNGPPVEWEKIIPGPLSASIGRTLPGFPEPTERLTNAKENAAKLNAKKVSLRDCDAEQAELQRAAPEDVQSG